MIAAISILVSTQKLAKKFMSAVLILTLSTRKKGFIRFTDGVVDAGLKRTCKSSISGFDVFYQSFKKSFYEYVKNRHQILFLKSFNQPQLFPQSEQ